jgi:hypothetical protein
MTVQNATPKQGQWVSKGYEPRKGRHGIAFIRCDDWTKPVEGLPDVPAEYRQHLQPKPVAAER